MHTRNGPSCRLKRSEREGNQASTLAFYRHMRQRQHQTLAFTPLVTGQLSLPQHLKINLLLL